MADQHTHTHANFTPSAFLIVLIYKLKREKKQQQQIYKAEIESELNTTICKQLENQRLQPE